MNILTTVLVLVGVSAFLKYLTKVSNEPVQESASLKILKPAKLFNYAGFVSFLLGAIFPVLYYIDIYHRDSKGLIASILMFVVFGSIGIYLFLYSKNTKVEFNEKTIKTINFLGKSKAINWSEINTIDYVSTAKWLVLKSNNTKVYVPEILKGFCQFKEEVVKKISPEKYKEAFLKMKS